ncbi:EAL domain-containing response regulator [Pseudomonas japonica]|uniref:EAL domain, c-di-GMP-specific phosphodiesterase class I (Or its enzymatically inactive variant) n=1 Tax=Pseudomonas japonica TaxID=256466 RepID=A0A239IQT3_9PSED|nr:EAL domain-containing response regulator [Pseudomonas japonica]SNS95921.1 EAL domain, c-di-GMP-specific phosphodiesterase class I (or its enzymatically inactive variant) [Pseudomonas japonica]
MHSLKVLILEDHPFQLMALHQMLNANGVFDVLAAESVSCAMQMLERRGPVDVAICDLYMDGPDGLAMIRHLAEKRLASALVVLSDAEPALLDNIAELAPQLGLRLLGCLQKPASGAMLHRLLGEYHDSASEPVAISAAPQIIELGRLSPEQLAHSRAQWKVNYQPRLDADGALLAVEASVRWLHPTLGLLASGQFFTVMQGAGLLDMLTWHVLDKALAVSAAIRLDGDRPLPMVVNVAPALLLGATFVDRLLALLRQHRLPAGILTLAVDERHCGRLDAVQVRQLAALRRLGCRLCLDGFGRGTTNLRQLFDLPLNELKLAAEFVRAMAEDGTRAAVVAAALILARRCELDVVVNDVDTLSDWQAVQGLGRPLVQGNFLARPMSGGELLKWISGRDGANLGQKGVA